MKQPMPLPGLERLMDVCQRLNLGLKTSPPASEPRRAGSSLEGLPFDPVLASVYSRLGHAAFATKLMGKGWILDRSNDHARQLEENNKVWRLKWWRELNEPMIVFGGDIYSYATVPSLSDEARRQPVVEVNAYEDDEIYVMPVASNVDKLFDSYSHYLEALVTAPGHQAGWDTKPIFPWDATEMLSRDERLVELMRARRFDSLMKNMKGSNAARSWFEKVAGVPL